MKQLKELSNTDLRKVVSANIDKCDGPIRRAYKESNLMSVNTIYTNVVDKNGNRSINLSVCFFYDTDDIGAKICFMRIYQDSTGEITAVKFGSYR